ncbi:VanZ family protein [Cohnella candidum]|uniref:VanZ family protein n=1 Tax=Cohnella candidum TaxID=2674991 RepID=A0A3G3JZX6_9BACL|nr:VanZ family protein [Cohnella candidum]AYQ73815.1 VanZ family protein [Cohnella candidum]
MAKIGYGAFLLGWMAVMFLFSSQPFERQDMRPWLERLVSSQQLERYLSWVDFTYGGHPVSIEELGAAEFVQFFIRKAAHVTEYAILGCLTLLLLRAIFRGRSYLPIAAALLCFAFAATDEYHQSFVGGRTPLPEDVLLDTLGACLGTVLTLLAIGIGGRPGRRAGQAKGKEKMG